MNDINVDLWFLFRGFFLMFFLFEYNGNMEDVEIWKCFYRLIVK